MTHKQHFDLYVSSFAEDGGLVRVRLDGKSGKIEKVSMTPLPFPMYTVKSKDELLAITRYGGTGDFGALYRFLIKEDGALIQQGDRLGTDGVVPCHLDTNGKDVYVVNYLSGNVKHLGGKTVRHEGRGPNSTRQEAAHTHCVKIASDGRVIVTDLGLDSVFVYSRELDFLSKARVPDGYGARHMAFSDDGEYLYVVNELVSSVTVFKYDGSLTALGTYKASPDINGNTAAAIRLCGDELFVSNRGHDSVAVFTADGASLKFKKYVKTYGREPRDFDVYGRFLVCTNQKSNLVTVVDGETGELVSTLEVVEPLCVTQI